MPRRKSKKGKSGKRGSQNAMVGARQSLMGRIVRVPFRTIQYGAFSGTTGFQTQNFPLRPNFMGDVASACSTGYHYYRCVDLSVTLIPPANATACFTNAVAYTGDYDTKSAPGGYDAMSQAVCFDLTNSFWRHASIHASRSQLLRQENEKWWDIQSTGGPDDEQYNQGRIWMAAYIETESGASDRFWLQIEGVVEFCQPVDSADAMGARLDKPLVVQKASYPSPDVKIESDFCEVVSPSVMPPIPEQPTVAVRSTLAPARARPPGIIGSSLRAHSLPPGGY